MGTPEAGTVEVEVLHAGDFPAPRSFVFRPRHRLLGGLAGFRPGAPGLRLPCLAWILRHPRAGVLLVDTGLHPRALESTRGEFGAVLGIAFRSLEPAGVAFDAQLRAAGVEPDAVERVIATHLHADHTSGLRLLPAARLVTTPEEWAAATARGATLKGYAGGHLPDAGRVELVDLRGDGIPFGVFERTVDLLGDGSVRLVSTPGHSAGHLSVLVRRPDGGALLIAGDAAYTLESIARERLPLLAEDDGEARATLRELRAFTEADPASLVVPTHDPEAWRAV